MNLRRVGCLLVFGWLVGCQTLADRWSPEGGGQVVPESYRSETSKRTGKISDHWWRMFGDATLNRLIKQLHDNNPDLMASLARVDQSYAVLGQTRSGQWPTIRGDGAYEQHRDSVNTLLFPTTEREYDQYRLGVSTSWEIDLWGKVRAGVERDRLKAEAESERYLNARLSLEANLVRQYLAWCSAHQELVILQEAMSVRGDDLALQQARLELGTGVEVDVTRSEVTLRTVEAAEEAGQRRVGMLEHAIAVLLGKAPSELERLSKPNQSLVLPEIPAGLPAALLIQRPDLRVAEKELLAAGKEVGVRKVSFLPSISLTGSGGVASLKSGNLFHPGSTLFDIGPEVTVPLFQAGTRANVLASARAEWNEAVAKYHSAILNAVREVDDALLDLKSFSRELAIQNQALAAADQTSKIARLRQERGLASYFEVVEAERDRLANARAANTLKADVFGSVVRLIQALGGTW